MGVSGYLRVSRRMSSSKNGANSAIIYVIDTDLLLWARAWVSAKKRGLPSASSGMVLCGAGIDRVTYKAMRA